MKTIEQRDGNDCGVACVAMLAGVKYKVAHAVIYPEGRSRKTRTKDLHDALVELGRKPLATRRKPFGSKKLADLETDALVFVEIRKIEAKHWVVWDAAKKKVRDPYPTKEGFDRLGYLPIK